MKKILVLALVCLSCDGQIVPRSPRPKVDPTNPTHPTGELDCTKVTSPPRRVRRLTRLELEATASAVMRQPQSIVGQLAPDVVIAGFDTLSDALTVTPLLAEQLGTLSEKFAAEVKATPARFGACTDTGAACRDAFISDFGARAFRRALSPVELAEYQQLYALAAADGHPTASALVAEAMLQSPFFIYRTELGTIGTDGKYALTRDELVQELSFLITGAPPDAALRAAAVEDPAVLLAQAERLLATPAAQEQLGTFFEKWLAIDGIAFAPKSGAQAVGFDDAVRASMREEARRLHNEVFTSGGTYGALLTPGYGVVDATLASFYGLPGPAAGAGFVRTPWPGTERGGLLTLGSLLAVYGKATGSAPVQRGEVIRERVLCEELPPPPPNVNAQPPVEVAGKTTRERYAAHEAVASCAACHRKIDGIGFGFESYDGVGRYRTTDNGLPVDDSGDVRQIDGKAVVSFKGVRGLATALSESAQARGCYQRQWIRFGMGSDGERDGFACEGHLQEAAFAKSDQPLRAAVLALVGSNGFRFRDGPAQAVVPPTETPITFNPPDGGTAPVVNGLEVLRKVSSDWPTGFCDDVTAKNVGAAPLEWKVLLQVGGTVNQSWNSTYAVATGGVEFVGVAWNKTLAPGATASFGFCATK